MKRPGTLAAAWEICKKDVRIERRTGEIVATAGVFSIVIGFLASMAFHVNDKTNAATAAGTIWITIFFAATLSFGRVWQRERDESALTGLLVAPIPRASIFLGKMLGVLVFLLAVEMIVVPIVALMFHVDLPDVAAPLALVLFLGTIGVAATGTLFGAMTVRTRARDLVLATVLFPLLSPTLVSGVAASREIIGASAVNRAVEMGDVQDYILLLVLFDVVAVFGGVALFGALVED